MGIEDSGLVRGDNKSPLKALPCCRRVDVYREALHLPGKNPEDVVAELHHREDFECEEARALTAQWKTKTFFLRCRLHP